MNSWGLTKTQNNFSGARDLMCLTWCQATTRHHLNAQVAFQNDMFRTSLGVTSCKFKCMSRHNSKRNFGHHKQKAKAMNRKKLMLAQPQRTPPTPWTNRNSSKTRYHTWFFLLQSFRKRTLLSCLFYDEKNCYVNWYRMHDWHCGPFVGPHRPSEPGIAALPRWRPQ